MGAKSGLVFLGEGRPAEVLKTLPEPDPERSAALADTILGGAVASAGTRVLGEGGVWPERGTVCVGAYDGFALVGYDRLGPDRPSDISGWIDAVSPTGGAHGVFMHSVVDYCAFAVWEGGELRRSVSLAPDSGVMEDLGDRLSFEAPFWDGKHPMDEGYPLPFHPLEFGEAALGACFGFGIEGDPSTYEFDPFAFTVPAFRLAE